MKASLSNQKGLTLMEVIASIVILSIILISFFPLLIQSAKFVSFNDEKLTAVNVAEEVVADLRFIKQPQELESIGYRLEGSDYIDDHSYPEYEVKVSFRGQTVASILRGALISVTPTSEEYNHTVFKTEMYIEEGNQP